MTVNANVYDLLQRCSSVSTSTYLWIDSICIDQNNDDEKSFQVRMMRNIYANSIHVLICLGNGPASPAINLMTKLEDLRNTQGEKGLEELFEIYSYYDWQRFDLQLRAEIKALCSLLRHPWFRRVWLVQEVVVAREATLCWGNYSISLNRLEQLMEFIYSPNSRGTVRVFLSRLASPAGSGFSGALNELYNITTPPSLDSIVSYRHLFSNFGPQSLTYLLCCFWDREATVPVDKIFALIGLAKPYTPDATGLIDYSKSTAEALTDVSRFLQRVAELPEVLHLAGIGRKHQNSSIPSWVVDWTSARPLLSLNSPYMDVSVRYCASKLKCSKVEVGERANEIRVKGQMIDTISAVLPEDNLYPKAESDLSLGRFNSLMMTYMIAVQELAKRNVCDPYRKHHMNQSLDEAV